MPDSKPPPEGPPPKGPAPSSRPATAPVPPGLRPSASRPAAPLFESGPRPPPPPPPAPPAVARPSGARPPAPGPVQAPAPALAPPPPRRKRSTWPFWAALAVIVLALPVAYWLLLSRAEPAPPAPVGETPAAPAPVELKIGKVQGKVEIRRADGEWAQAAEGQPLLAADEVRTGEGSFAVLAGGEQYEVQMEADTLVAVDELTDSISRVMLGGGMATARVVGGTGKHTFEVRAQGSDAVARTRQGVFTVTSNGTGTVAVGTREGEVEFAGAGKTVIVRAGQQSVARPGQGPSDPAPVPTSLLLKVSWPQGAVITRKAVVLTGQAEPGSRVEIQGKSVLVDAEGRFKHTLRLGEGRSTLSVQARGVSGLSAESNKQIQVDTKAPGVKLDDLWDR